VDPGRKRSKGFGITDVRVREKRAKSGTRLAVAFQAHIPRNERVRLNAIVDVEFREDYLTRAENQELERQLLELVRTRRIGAKKDRDETKGAIRNDLFFEKVEDAVTADLTSSGAEVPIDKTVSKARVVERIGRHPHRKSRPVSRTWIKSSPLASGEVGFEVAVSVPHARVSVWLDRDVSLRTGPVATSAPSGDDGASALPNDWQGKLQLTLNLVDARVL